MNKPGGSDAGFSLIEILIALVLLAFGTLALFNLELRALQNAQLAYSRSIASMVALDAAEHLWAVQAESGGEHCLSQNTLDGVAGALADRWNKADAGRHDFSVTLTDVNDCGVSIQVRTNKNLAAEDEDKVVRFQLTLPRRDDLGDNP